MGTAAILSGIGAAFAGASAANSYEATRSAKVDAKDQKRDIAAQRVKQEKQQADEKLKIKDKKKLDKDKASAETRLARNARKQSGKDSRGREGTILTDGAGAAPAAGAASTLGGASGSKNLLGL